MVFLRNQLSFKQKKTKFMKQLKQMAAIAATVLALTSCQKESKLSPSAAEEAQQALAKTADVNNEGSNLKGGNKHVYTLSNQVSGNAVLVYDRAGNGMLTYSASYATGGTGTGGGLGNQGALIMGGDDDDDDVLLAVNAGSNSVSSFKIKSGGLTLKSTVSSGGMMPVSITQYDDIVFVLNGGSTNNISGFKLRENGQLDPIANSTRPLSAASTGPAQISFVNEGKVLVITEKGTNKIITYTVNEWGIPGAMHSITSSSPTPFGFAPADDDYIFVSEAAGGAPGASVLSSYRIANNGSITLIHGSVGAGQSAACWVVLNKKEKYAYTTNTASNNLTNFNVNGNSGHISVNAAIAATTGMGPIDAALNNNSKYLYVLNAGSHSIGVYSVAGNGSLSMQQTVTGVPAGATGLAAR
jgi:6-phosphogluconolactonase (cycloisomerase 2 family)